MKSTKINKDSDRQIPSTREIDGEEREEEREEEMDKDRETEVRRDKRV
jgi:hypothetical protein